MENKKQQGRGIRDIRSIIYVHSNITNITNINILANKKGAVLRATDSEEEIIHAVKGRAPGSVDHFSYWG